RRADVSMINDHHHQKQDPDPRSASPAGNGRSSRPARAAAIAADLSDGTGRDLLERHSPAHHDEWASVAPPVSARDNVASTRSINPPAGVTADSGAADETGTGKNGHANGNGAAGASSAAVSERRRILRQTAQSDDDVDDTPWGDRLRIRHADSNRDLDSIRRLYATGLLGGALSPNDTAADLDRLQDAYFGDDGQSAFWVAELTDLSEHEIDQLHRAGVLTSEDAVAGHDRPKARHHRAGDSGDRSAEGVATGPSIIIGTIGFQCVEEHVGEFRRLRVHPMFRQRGVGTRLVKTALRHAKTTGNLKVILNSNVQQLPAMTLFQRFGFQLSRTRNVHGKAIHEFYLNLYTDQPLDSDDNVEPESDSDVPMIEVLHRSASGEPANGQHRRAVSTNPGEQGAS
ncbi:MAG: GNAT family N-acetyltransferase, partial [Planctomycetota bacterium]